MYLLLKSTMEFITYFIMLKTMCNFIKSELFKNLWSYRHVGVVLHFATAQAVDHGDHGRVFVQFILLLF